MRRLGMNLRMRSSVTATMLSTLHEGLCVIRLGLLNAREDKITSDVEENFAPVSGTSISQSRVSNAIRAGIVRLRP